MEVGTVLFQVTLHENGSLGGQRLRIWTEGCRDLLRAGELLYLFQDIILVTRKEPLTAELLILQKSRKVQLDMRTDKCDFFLCQDEKQPTCC